TWRRWRSIWWTSRSLCAGACCTARRSWSAGARGERSQRRAVAPAHAIGGSTMTKEQRLAQTVALVTGAGRGIGRAIALRFAAEGAAVAALDRDGEAAAATAGEISAGGGHALALQADIADQAQVQAAVSRVVERFGRLDILVNNAAVSAAGDFIDGP